MYNNICTIFNIDSSILKRAFSYLNSYLHIIIPVILSHYNIETSFHTAHDHR